MLSDLEVSYKGVQGGGSGAIIYDTSDVAFFIGEMALGVTWGATI